MIFFFLNISYLEYNIYYFIFRADKGKTALGKILYSFVHIQPYFKKCTETGRDIYFCAAVLAAKRSNVSVHFPK